MNVKLRPEKYLKYLYLPNLFGTQRTKEILSVNPTVVPQREEAQEVCVFVFDYNNEALEEKQLENVEGALAYKQNNRISWINIDGLRKADVEMIGNHFGIHPLLMEDILSINQRPKLEEVDEILFSLLNMLYYNNENQTVEQEQISIALGKDFLLSFQEEAERDVFDPVRDILSNILRSESDLLDDRTTKYFNDVYDHIIQAYELSENYRDIMVSMQDLYINNVNLRMNEVMKVMAIVTCLLAPATVIGGIFGMNFEKIPYLHNTYGFWIAVFFMLAIPVWMITMF